jgi:hypothetical protein
MPTSEAPPAAGTDQILAKVLKSLPPGSAAGPSGWTYEHIKAATGTSEDAQAAVLRHAGGGPRRPPPSPPPH